ncbi:MAG TPA: hypothetical protein PKD04_00035 [Rhodocyclaceae bacterium]|nr:hypothetical protein [Rhodocyclaceae bacterium]HMV20205.1 hypothetical protein [Rhodocyclaceae bacterium]HMW77654.1 hypothetical protein [Rhodocyclaceae bacterium]HNL22273.1 hypothetical protein [Rhodocyclaceae bacterium]HNM22751.1 hypothetical protein [Rhodocyclaceae bacterium]
MIKALRAKAKAQTVATERHVAGWTKAIALLMALKLLGSRKTARLIAAAGTWKTGFHDI